MTEYQQAPLSAQEGEIIHAIVQTMKVACVLATQRDQLVAEGGHTVETARDYLVAKWGGPDKPVADLIDWWDHECHYSTPAFTRIMEALNVKPAMREYVIRCGAEADGVMAKMRAAAMKVN